MTVILKGVKDSSDGSGREGSEVKGVDGDGIKI